VIELGINYVTLEAFFDRDDMLFHGMKLLRGDLFVETYYFDRWYNVYEIHAREDGLLRGYYCNIGTPPSINGKQLSYIDLALDLLVFPDGRQLVLDKEEFEALPIKPETRLKALAALDELKGLFSGDQNTIHPQSGAN
jgi:predicted RNA-binding protein associated with RNAse of E/G family